MIIPEPTKRALSTGEPSYHLFPVLTPVIADGEGKWVSSDETYRVLLTFGDDPLAVATRRTLDRVLNEYSHYSGERDDAHAGALHVAWALQNPNNPVAASTLSFRRARLVGSAS